MKKYLHNASSFLETHLDWVVFILTTLISIFAFAYSYNHDLVTAYGDSKAHLNMSRRVLDSLAPGLAQLGGVWLPLFHILMLPTIGIDFFWRTGLSGAIISMLSFIASTWLVYKSVLLIREKKLNAFIGAIVMILNVNLLYMQTTAMTEALFIFTLVASTYFLIKWTKSLHLSDLICVAFFVFLATTTRYEGWGFAAVVFFCVCCISLIKQDLKRMESNGLIYGALAYLGIIAWFIWQLAIFGDPTYFLHSEYSSKGQTLIAIKAGEVPTYHNLLMTFAADFFSLVHVLGIFAVALALTAFVYILYEIYRQQNKATLVKYVPLLALLAPFFFLALAMYNGNVPINVPEVVGINSPARYFNIRYALYTLPFLSLIIPNLAVNKILTTTVCVLLCVNVFAQISYEDVGIATLADATESGVSFNDSVSDWLHKNYKGGKVIISATIADPIIYKTDLPMRIFITEGSGTYWRESMTSPAKYAKYLIKTDSARDMVKKRMNAKSIDSQFHLVKKLGEFSIYEKNTYSNKN